MQCNENAAETDAATAGTPHRLLRPLMPIVDRVLSAHRDAVREERERDRLLHVRLMEASKRRRDALVRILNDLQEMRVWMLATIDQGGLSKEDIQDCRASADLCEKNIAQVQADIAHMDKETAHKERIARQRGW
jgi:hypothetical protein